MNITLIHVGQLKEGYFAEAAAEYEKRLGGFCEFRSVLIKEARIDDKSTSESEIEAALNSEGECILYALPPKGKCLRIALCIEGELYSTEKLCKCISDARESGKDICFIIGGSRGLSEAVKRECTVQVSMSPMTFPHRLARIMLTEQLYRVATMIQGKRYHK